MESWFFYFLAGNFSKKKILKWFYLNFLITFTGRRDVLYGSKYVPRAYFFNVLHFITCYVAPKILIRQTCTTKLIFRKTPKIFKNFQKSIQNCGDKKKTPIYLTEIFYIIKNILNYLNMISKIFFIIKNILDIIFKWFKIFLWYKIFQLNIFNHAKYW